MPNQRFVIIGGDAAGMSAASLAKRRRPDLEVEAYEMGDYTSYGACGMPYYVSGQVPELNDLVVVTPEEFRAKRGIQVFMRHRVERIHPDRRVIEVRDLSADRIKEVPYDDLLIATGAEPIVPPGMDLTLPGVFVLRGLPDAGDIKTYIRRRRPKEGLIIGAGYIGMEMAEALTEAGVRTTVLGRRPQVLPVFEKEIADSVAEELDRHGVRLVFQAEAERLEPWSGDRIRVHLTNGEALTTDMVVIGVGVRPRSGLAAEAGLDLGVKKAVRVDRMQRTSQDHIWAAGDCAEAYHLLLQRNAYVPLALTANRQGRIVGNNVVGMQAEFPGILGTTICKVFDLTVARTGLGMREAAEANHEAVKVIVSGGSRAHYYPGGGRITTVLTIDPGDQRLLGAQMVGRDGVAHRINTWAAALTAGLSLTEIHGLDLAYAPPFSPVWDPVLVAAEIALKQTR